MVISELTRQKDELREKISRSGKLSSVEIEGVLSDVDACLGSIIQLMKDGKSAHDKFFSDIILYSIDAIIGLDPEFKIFLWNKGAEDLFGYKKNEVMGKDFEFLIPDYLLKKGERKFLIEEVQRNGFLANYESERLTKSGKMLSVSISRFAIFSDKESIGSVGILRDITNVKALQKELREKENLALIGEVVSSIAHSLSNPLNIISGNADYLLLNRKENSPDYDELRTIVDEATRITKSLRGLLNFSRPITVEKTRNNINRIIEDIVTNSKFSIGKKDIIIRKELDKGLPDLMLDKAQIEDALSNLVINAIQAFASKGEITVRTQSYDSKVMIDITDNGPGIPKEILEKIFQPFFTSKGYGKGTGLGLSIVKRIIKEHNGEIKVKSQVGKGTTFIILLPMH
ncbi:MAG: PAS domain S-box protein [Ignavibacteria bacterium]|nr:PAS domain S-box protein [Ignavibacteria bacterium]